MLTATAAHAGLGLNTDAPIGFFTNVADRLLQRSSADWLARDAVNGYANYTNAFGTNRPFGAGNIPVYVNGRFVYTPAVHRVLQLAANLFAAIHPTNDIYGPLPPVFRSQFTNDDGNIYIRDFVEVTSANQLTGTRRDLSTTNVAANVQPDDLIFGVPLVVGARKGLPNFNEFAAETVIQITRKVELLKSAPGGANTIFQTNQMFIIGISNVFGAEFWNSYTNNYTRPVDIIATNFCAFSLTNDYGFVYNSLFVAGGQISIPSGGTNFWCGFTNRYSTPRPTELWPFLVPLRTNQIIVPDAVYQQGANRFVPLTETFEPNSGFAFPRWGLTVTNLLLAMIKDRASGRIIDYVQLNGLGIARELTSEIAQPRSGQGFDGLWATNGLAGGWLSDQPGVIQQIEISKGNVESGGNWQNYGIAQPSGATKAQAIANFLAFFTPDNLATYVDPETQRTYYGTNLALRANAPFTPTSKRSVPVMWQANDPLVHYTAGDLEYLERSESAWIWSPPAMTNATLRNLGLLNERYRPWGGNPIVAEDPYLDPLAYQPVVKDPLLWSPDRWNFPDSEPLSFAMLARVHRGTPWQTVYLKSTSVTNAVQRGVMKATDWRNWTGDRNPYTAELTQPETDRGLLDLFTALVINTNDSRHLISFNETQTTVWLAALDGIVALTNSTSDDALNYGYPPQLDPITVTSNSTQAVILAEGIRAARAVQPNQLFSSLGALLAVSELSEASPFLNHGVWDDSGHNVQLERGISDEAYETIPSQLLPRLRLDSAGSIFQTNGTLRIWFTGLDGYPYAIEMSSNLLNWLPVSTNYPTNGVFELPETIISGGLQRFYRSALLP